MLQLRTNNNYKKGVRIAEQIDISVVVPIWNEEKENIWELYLRLTKVLISLERTYEIIFVDDGSTDRTYEIAKKFQEKEPRYGYSKTRGT
jgi:glycosyltransferase involved in cell wall biosynthesis